MNMYKEDLALNNLQGLICPKTQLTMYICVSVYVCVKIGNTIQEIELICFAIGIASRNYLCSSTLSIKFSAKAFFSYNTQFCFKPFTTF